jgi:hypothetical protein
MHRTPEGLALLSGFSLFTGVFAGFSPCRRRRPFSISRFGGSTAVSSSLNSWMELRAP